MVLKQNMKAAVDIHPIHCFVLDFHRLILQLLHHYIWNKSVTFTLLDLYQLYILFLKVGSNQTCTLVTRRILTVNGWFQQSFTDSKYFVCIDGADDVEKVLYLLY